MQKIFLGSHQSGLQSLREFILPDSSETPVDLSDTAVVLPTSRSGRRLLELLLLHCQQANVSLLSPPKILTPGSCLQFLYDDQEQQISDAETRLLWWEVLKNNPDLLGPILQESPVPENSREWLELAAQFDRLHRELSAACLDYDELFKYLEHRSLENEVNRWHAILAVKNQYMSILKHHSLIDVFSERLQFNINTPVGINEILVCGCVDLLPVMSRALEAVGEKVKILICDSPENAAFFDDSGCVVPGMESGMDLSIPTSNISLVEQFEEQGLAVAATIEKLADHVYADDLVIACCDETSWSFLQADLDRFGIKARPSAGEYLKFTKLFLLLDTIRAVLSDSSFKSYADLIRHPLLSSWIEQELADKFQGRSVAAVFDTYHNYHLPHILNKNSLSLHNQEDQIFKDIFLKIKDLLLPFRNSKKTVNDWGVVLYDIFLKLRINEFSGQNASFDESFGELKSIIGSFIVESHELSALDFLNLVLHIVGEKRVPYEPDSEALDLLGWLELQMDDVSTVIVTDCIESKLPATLKAGDFLPDSIRSEFNIDSNAKRLARDHYLLRSILASKTVHFVASRRSVNGAYALPSRFLCSVSDSGLAERVEKLVSGSCTIIRIEDSGDKQDLPGLPEVQVDTEISSVSVTSLRTYLECPYLYYLQHVCRLNELNDRKKELDALDFGNLIHNVLHQFAVSGNEKLDNPNAVNSLLSEILDTEVKAVYGSDAESAVYVQVEQARYRLNEFASTHCQRLNQGWFIDRSEWAWPREDVKIKLPDTEVFLTGRIDRIERHEKSGEIVVLDYKTGDTAIDASSAHRKKIGRAKDAPFEWIGLQLPAYHFALRQTGETANIQLGYFSLPASSASAGIDLLNWDNSVLLESEKQLFETVKNIHSKKFWPPKICPHENSPLYKLYIGAEKELLEVG